MPNERGSKNYNNGTKAGDRRQGLTRERPWLLPSNRKLRHLQGISLRNLNVISSQLRKRGHTIDDESLPHTLKTPAKILAQKEHKLEISRSSTDLRSSTVDDEFDPTKPESDNDMIHPRRPSKGRLRRRSTLHWSSAPPRTRQERLENIVREKMADSWFSIHCTDRDSPIYISEIIEKSMNPDFRFFDLNVYGPAVTRSEELTIKYWAKTEKMQTYNLLIELQLSLRSLQFIGKSLDTFHHPLPQNCIVFHMSDGIYTSFTGLPPDDAISTTSNSMKPTNSVDHTSSFDSLMRLSDLDDCIQDALSTREKLASQISKILTEQQVRFKLVNHALQAKQSLSSTTQAVTQSRNLLKSAQTRRSELQASLKSRRAAISLGEDAQIQAERFREISRDSLLSQNSLIQATRTSLSGQIRRICQDLLSIYPIEPIEKKTLSFTIRGLCLPNATSSSTLDADPVITAAALGYIAQMVHLLSFYLWSPIPYPPSPQGSTSTILDSISTNMPSVAARTFPLYQKGAVAYRFEYGVFLLNSDIELLMSKQGSRMVDLRHTLPNLKYLLTVLTDGKGELPLRKRDRAKLIVDARATGDERTANQTSLKEQVPQPNGGLGKIKSFSDEHN